MIKKLLIVLLATAAVTSRAEKPLRQAQDRANVLFIFADDMNTYMTRDLGVAVKTPHLDKLREQSILFEHAYCASPVCGPSRAALLSGIGPHRTGAYLNGADPWRKSELLINCTTFPELMRNAGYETWGMGKLSHAKMTERHGKSMWSNTPRANGGFSPFPPEEKQMSGKFFSVLEWDGPDSDFPDVKSTDSAIEFLNMRRDDKPFFMMVGLWRPHNPYTAPRRFFDMYKADEITFPPGYVEDDMKDIPPLGIQYSRVFGSRWDKHGVRNPKDWKRVLHGYLACTAFADWSTGRVIEALDASPYSDNTIVVFSSDNGFHLGEKHHFGKSTLWENSAQVPLLVRMPKNANAGSTCSATVSLIDLYPTLKELCGLEEPMQKLDGNSFAAQLSDPSKDWSRPALTCYGENMTSLRDETWRYILYRDGTEELYNLKKDPFELSNLAANPETKAARERMKAQLPKKFITSLGGRDS